MSRISGNFTEKMEEKQLFRNLRKKAECPLCLETLKEPKTLPCLHSFCLVCLDKLGNLARRQLQTTVNCPVCLTTFHIPEGETFAGLPASFHLNRLVDTLALGDDSAKAQTCNSCEEKNIATCYCFDCNDFFCDDCVRFHNRMKMSRHHRNVLIQNLQAQDIEKLMHRPVMCAKKYHEKEQLEYYCQECKVCICHKCGLVKHDRHAKVDIQQAAEEQKMQMMDVLEKVKAKVSVCDQEMKRVRELFEKSKEEIVAAQNKVRATIKELVQVLREHETAMIGNLNEICETQQKAHEIQHKNFELLTTRLRSSVEYGESIIQRNIGPEILQAQCSVVARCEELLNGEKMDSYKLPGVSYVTNEQSLQNIRQAVPGQVITSYTDPSRSVGGGEGSVHVTSHQYQYLFTFGSRGEGQGQFDGPEGITVSEITGNIAVADQNNKRIQLFSSKGEFLREFGQQGPGAERLSEPYAVAFTRSGDVIVSHGGAGQPNRICVFAESGPFIKHITNKYLMNPWRVSVGRDGHLIVCDCGDKTIKVLSPDGIELLQSFSASDCIQYPTFAVYHHDKFFVSYHWAHFVKVFNKEGVFLYNIGSGEGSGDGQLDGPVGLAVDKFNNLIVCDEFNSRLQVFTLEGKFVTKIGGQLTELGNLWSVAVSNDGHVFVTDIKNDCVHVFQ